MDFWIGAGIFFGLTAGAALLGDAIRHLRLKAGFRYGDEDESTICDGCGEIFGDESS